MDQSAARRSVPAQTLSVRPMSLMPTSNSSLVEPQGHHHGFGVPVDSSGYTPLPNGGGYSPFFMSSHALSMPGAASATPHLEVPAEEKALVAGSREHYPPPPTSFGELPTPMSHEPAWPEGFDPLSLKRKHARPGEDNLSQPDDEVGTPTGSPGDEPAKKRRRPLQLEFVQDKTKRHVSFSKRKSGLLKKAHELHVLTGADVMLVIASETGNVYRFASDRLRPLVFSEAGQFCFTCCLVLVSFLGLCGEEGSGGVEIIKST